MTGSSASTEGTLPAIITPDPGYITEPPGLVSWIGDHREKFESTVLRAGAALFRGFNIDDPESFRHSCLAIRPELKSYAGGDSPRESVGNKIYTSTEYRSDLEVLLHNELSYAGWCPEMVFFGCLVPARSGGETHLADGRRILASLDPDIRSRFQEKGITYYQNLWDQRGQPGPGKSWQETFETDSKTGVEDYLVQSNMKFEWTDYGLRTAATKNAIQSHPITGEPCWHNQADQWHRDMPSVKDSVAGTEAGAPQKQVKTSFPGNHVTFGDGSEIDIEDLIHIREVSARCEVVLPWEAGDMLAIDNVLTMHGRKPFTGERQVIVAMA